MLAAGAPWHTTKKTEAWETDFSPAGDTWIGPVAFPVPPGGEGGCAGGAGPCPRSAGRRTLLHGIRKGRRAGHEQGEARERIPARLVLGGLPRLLREL